MEKHPMEELFCESWDEAQRLCDKRYPDSCPSREVCLEMVREDFGRAERADIERAVHQRRNL